MPRIGLIACVLLFVLSPSWSSAQIGYSRKIDLGMPLGVTADKFGNVFVADTKHCMILLVNPQHEANVFAGTGICGYRHGDGHQANQSPLNHPAGLAIDSSGNIYIADTFNNVIRMVDTSGIIHTVAGDRHACSPSTRKCGDGGPATEAELNHPASVAFDAAGNMYIADTKDNRIRKVNKKGIISTFLGTGRP
jgi:DNA-binding beta-propeller fold protein YncE